MCVTTAYVCMCGIHTYVEERVRPDTGGHICVYWNVRFCMRDGTGPYYGQLRTATIRHGCGAGTFWYRPHNTLLIRFSTNYEDGVDCSSLK
jgi:hypothetical protein